MTWLEETEKLIPRAAGRIPDWEAVTARFSACSAFARLGETPQNPVYHGEGDVGVHTRMVCEALAEDPEYGALTREEQTAAFIAAVLHDTGKAVTTQWADGAWHSPHHAPAGARIARSFLWEECGLCGTADALRKREEICALIRRHMVPPYLPERDHPEREIRRIAAAGETAPLFTWRLLCLLSKADISGRIACDRQEQLDQVALSRLMAEEAGCLNGPGKFTDRHVRRAYFAGRKVLPDQPLYDDTWGEVTMLSGLPGTGKDTWIARNLPGLPMVSLDRLREELNIRPTENQSPVAAAAQDRARALLRQHQPFVWNAANLSRERREGLIALFERCGARVRIVYLETDLPTLLARNINRAAAVPERVLLDLLQKTEPPQPYEAHTVEWRCV